MSEDLLKQLLEEEEETEEEEEVDDKLAAIEAKLEASEKEKHGLLQSVKDERRKRQDIRDRLNTLTDTVQTLLETRKQKTANEIIAEASKGKGIPVSYNEDGDGFLDPTALEPVLAPYKEEILNLRQQLQLTNQTVETQQESSELLNSILGEDERYNSAYSHYKKAIEWVNDKVVEYQKDNRTEGEYMRSGEALDKVFNADLEAEFNSAFNGLDLERIVTAEDSVRQFRNMLNNVVATTTPKETTTTKKADETFTKVLNKPSALGKSTNAKTGSTDPIETVANFKAEDILNLSDAAAEALEKAMLQEEQSDGVKF